MSFPRYLHRSLLVSLFCLLTALPLVAAPWTAETLPMVYLQDARRFTNNPEGVLSATAVDTIDAILYRLEQQTGVQTVVVAVKQLEGNDPYNFAMSLADRYKIGQKGRDNGLIIVLAIEDRSFHILTGRGLEGTLPDAICKRIENRVMLPALKAGDWDAAMVGAVKSAAGYLLGDETQRQALQADVQEEDGSALFSMLIAFGVLLLFGIVTYLQNNKQCPRCGKRFSFKRSRSQQRQDASHIIIRERWHCNNCGHTENHDHTTTMQQNGSRGGFGGPFVFPGSWGRGSSSNGGFRGGSFGGGSFGGGGAGGRF